MALTDDQLRHVHRFLAPDEALVWAGQPVPAQAMRATLPILFFAVPWTAFSLMWTAMAGGAAWFAANKAGPVGLVGIAFPLFGVPFILIGLAMLAAPYFAWRAAQKTVFVVTDRRALIGTPAEGGFAVKEYAGDDLSDLRLNVRSDGTGTIDFGAHQMRHRTPGESNEGRTLGQAMRPHSFSYIPEVERVFDLLRALARAPEASASGAALPAHGDGAPLGAPQQAPLVAGIVASIVAHAASGDTAHDAPGEPATEAPDGSASGTFADALRAGSPGWKTHG